MINSVLETFVLLLFVSHVHYLRVQASNIKHVNKFKMIPVVDEGGSSLPNLTAVLAGHTVPEIITKISYRKF